MNIKKELEPVWNQICNAGNIYGNIGTGLQDSLHEKIRPLLPNNIGYVFYFDMSGNCRHIFYEKNNENNQLIF